MELYWSRSAGLEEEFEKLVMRMNPPRVVIDNESDKKTTLVKVDSANKRGSLLQVVQVLTDLNLIIKKAYISSDGGWFMDVFHVTDEGGNKVYDERICDLVQQELEQRGRDYQSVDQSDQSIGIEYASEGTTIELLGRDRPGLLSEIFAVLTNLKCNVVGAEVWTHNSRMAAILYINDEASGLAIVDSSHLDNIKQLLLYVLKGSLGWRTANTVFTVGSIHVPRRLHQMMYDDRDYDNLNADDNAAGVRTKPLVTVEDCVEKGYTRLCLNCPDRPKLLFDTVCTITDMQYVIFHGTIVAEGPVAQQEYYIRHIDGYPISSEAEKQRVIHCLVAAIKRRSPEGVRLELCSEDRVGLLSEVTRIFRENGLSVNRAEVTTRDTQAVNVFYVTDASGCPVKSETIEAVRKAIGLSVLRVKDEASATSPPQQTSRFSLASLFRSRSENFLLNLGLIKSCCRNICSPE